VVIETAFYGLSPGNNFITMHLVHYVGLTRQNNSKKVV